MVDLPVQIDWICFVVDDDRWAPLQLINIELQVQILRVVSCVQGLLGALHHNSFCQLVDCKEFCSFKAFTACEV